MHQVEFLTNIGVALLAALVGGLLARAVRLPVLIGYLVAGVLVGPHTPGIIANGETVHSVANLGVALLMFAVGVHFSLDELKAVRKTAIVGGILQIGGMIILGVLLGVALGWGVYGGVFLGCALSLSSTAVMMRLLEERGETGTTHGSVMLGILVVQDMSLVLMAALLPALATLTSGGAGAWASVGLALLKAALFLLVTLGLATRGVPALMHRVARLGSPELFLLTGVGICLLAAVAAEYAGLGLALGAFLAGLVISESDYAHELFSQVRPLRDVFAALFFVSIGMLLNPVFVAEHWRAILFVVLTIVVGKGILTALAVFALGQHGRTAILTGLGLAQIGEFSFVLATLGSDKGLIKPEVSGVILSAALITLLLAPAVFGAGGKVYARFNKIPALARRMNRLTETETLETKEAAAGTRVLICGYGRVGRYVADALKAQNVPHVVVDFDGAAIARARESDSPTLYGDASSETVLAQTSPSKLQLAVVALPDAATTEMTTRALRKLAPSLPIVARVHRGPDIPRLRAAGADAVIHGEFEAGTEMIRQTLGRLHVPGGAVDKYMETVRQHRYREERV